MSHKLLEWTKDKKIAFLSPYNTPRGRKNFEIINGITGVPYTFHEEGVDCYWYHDIKNLPDNELQDIFNKYDLWIYPVFPEYFDVLGKIRDKYKGFVIGVTDIQTHVLSYWPLSDVSNFVFAINQYDAIMSTNIDEVETFRGVMIDPTKLAYTGWTMYPQEIHGEFVKKNAERDRNLISVGISNPGDFNRDILTNFAAYKKLKKRFPELKGFMYYVTPNKLIGLRKLIKQMEIKDFSLITELPYKQALEYLSKAYLAIHLYTFKVVGRLAQDCAALAVPLVGTVANFPNRLCFPYTSVEDYDVDGAVEHATQLLLNPFFWNKVTSESMRLSYLFYGVDATRDRVYNLLIDAGVITDDKIPNTNYIGKLMPELP
jgi:glycosyltransferase involved in cell wall biosynthesis